MLNQVVLVGRLTSDLETKELEDGKKVSNMTLAIPRSFKNADGEYETDFVDCSLWNTIAENTDEAKKQALWVIDKLNGEKLDLGITFDWENFKYWNSYKISFHYINETANTFMNTVKENGYDAMLYSSKFYLETIWENKLNYPVWLAHYVDSKTDYKGDYKIWQLCSNGRVDGIYGDVDMDILYKK